MSNKEKDKLNKELIESNDKLENFIEIYNDIVKEDEDKTYRKSNKFKNGKEDNINKLEKINEYLDKFDNKINTLNDKISKIEYAIKNTTLTNAEKNELQNKIKELNTQKDSINNELRHAVKVINNLKKKGKKSEESEEPEESEESEEFMRKFYNFMDEKKMILMVLIKMVFTEILVKVMILMVLIAMVFTLIPMINLIVKVLI